MTNLIQKTRFRAYVYPAVSVLFVLSLDRLPASVRLYFDDLVLGVFAVLVVLLLVASIWLPIETRALKYRAEMLRLGKHSAEDHLDELERLKRRAMVTPEEYVTKRQEILKDL
jgi:hypothetical protein